MRTSSDPVPADLIPTTEAARLAGVALATLYRWIGRGHLPAWKRVGRVMVVAGRRAGADATRRASGEGEAGTHGIRAAMDKWTQEVLEKHGLRVGPIQNAQQ